MSVSARALSGSSPGQRLDRYRHISFSGKQKEPKAEAAPPPATSLDPPPEEPDGEHIAFLRELLQGAGIEGSAYRSGPLHRRLRACLSALHARDPVEARNRLRGHPELTQRGTGALLIGVTEFFRDPPLFPCLRELVLPALLAQGRPPRVWSVGCSDGSELYSVAILLGEAGCLEGAELLGTDCRPLALVEAAQGLFRPEALRNLPVDLRRAWFLETPRGFQVCPRLRDATTWRRSDALRDGQGSSWDLLLCRNMAMYLKPSAAGALWDRLLASIRPGGFLVTGRAERPPRDGRLESLASSIFRVPPEAADAL